MFNLINYWLCVHICYRGGCGIPSCRGGGLGGPPSNGAFWCNPGLGKRHFHSEKNERCILSRALWPEIGVTLAQNWGTWPKIEGTLGADGEAMALSAARCISP